MSTIKTYINDGVDKGDGLGVSPTTMAAGASWEIALEEDKTLRKEFRRLETEGKPSLVGIQIKNASSTPLRIKVDGSSLAEIYIAKKQSEALIVENVQYIQVCNCGAGTVAASEVIVTVTTGASRVSGAAGLGDIFVTEDFGGKVFSVQVTTTVDTAFAAMATEKKLRDVVIVCSGYACTVGSATVQLLPLAVGDTLGFSWINLSTLYFKNKTVAEDTILTIVGVEQ